MHRISRFLILALTLYIAWFLLYDLWLGPDARLDQWLTDHVAKESVFLLKQLDYNVNYSIVEERSIIEIDNLKILRIAHACNGLILYALFIGFILAFPGPVLDKLWYIPMGIVGIYILNVIRVVVLVLIRLYFPQNLDFNHKYTFVLITYGFIFCLWMLWVNRFSGITHFESENTN